MQLSWWNEDYFFFNGLISFCIAATCCYVTFTTVITTVLHFTLTHLHLYTFLTLISLKIDVEQMCFHLKQDLPYPVTLLSQIVLLQYETENIPHHIKSLRCAEETWFKICNANFCVKCFFRWCHSLSVRSIIYSPVFQHVVFHILWE